MSGFIEISAEVTHITKSGYRYRVFHDGDVLLESCREPFTDGARAILALGGADLDDTLIYVDHKTRQPRLRARLGYAVAHTVTEGQDHGPRFVKWEPYTGPARKEDAEEA